MSSTLRHSAAYTLFLLFLINFLNFFDRAIPAVVLEPMRQEFGFSDTLAGLLATAFTLIYAAAGIPLGRLADRWSRTRILSFGVFSWSLFTAATGAAWNYTSLLLIRMGVGIGEASCAPAANAMIGDLYPSQKRARALGVFMLGLPLGSFACFAVAGAIAHQYGWRAPFFIAFVPGLMLAVLVWFLHEPLRGAQESTTEATAAPITQPFRHILRVPTVWWIIVSGASCNFAAYSINTFLPALLVRVHGLNLAQAGGISALVLGATGVVGLLAGGWIADALHTRHPRGRLLFGAASLLLAAPLLWLGFAQPVGAVQALTLQLAAGWLLVFTYYVTVYPALQDVIAPRLRATAMAVYFFFQYVLGGALGTVVTGALSDHYARAAMAAAGATELSPAFKAAGLKEALSLSVPLAIALTSVALLFAARSFVRDAAQRDA